MPLISGLYIFTSIQLYCRARPQGYKKSFSAQLSMNFNLLINVLKNAKNVSILTFFYLLGDLHLEIPLI